MRYVQRTYYTIKNKLCKISIFNKGILPPKNTIFATCVKLFDQNIDIFISYLYTSYIIINNTYIGYLYIHNIKTRKKTQKTSKKRR